MTDFFFFLRGSCSLCSLRFDQVCLLVWLLFGLTQTRAGLSISWSARIGSVPSWKEHSSKSSERLRGRKLDKDNRTSLCFFSLSCSRLQKNNTSQAAAMCVLFLRFPFQRIKWCLSFHPSVRQVPSGLSGPSSLSTSSGGSDGTCHAHLGHCAKGWGRYKGCLFWKMGYGRTFCITHGHWIPHTFYKFDFFHRENKHTAFMSFWPHQNSPALFCNSTCKTAHFLFSLKWGGHRASCPDSPPPRVWGS